MEQRIEKYTLELHNTYRQYPLKSQKVIKFLIKTGVLSGCIISPDIITKTMVYFTNPFTNKTIHIHPENLDLAIGHPADYIPESIKDRYNALGKSQEQSIDKFGGDVYLDSIVAYIHHKKSADESLRVGVVKHISKSGVVTVVDIYSGDKFKLANSKRHFVIDDTIFERLMIIKLSNKI